MLIEDQQLTARIIWDYLESRGLVMDLAVDGQAGLLFAMDNTYDVIVLNVGLPRLDGLELARRYRREGGAAAIIMLTARDRIEDKLLGFQAGADDYLTKPFELRELEARIHVLHRRKQREACVNLRVADLVLDVGARSAARQNRILSLSPSGYRLLEALMRNAPNVMRYAELADAVWGDTEHDPARLHTLVSNVRGVVDRPFDRPLIHTVHSFGYRLAPGFDA